MLRRGRGGLVGLQFQSITEWTSRQKHSNLSYLIYSQGQKEWDGSPLAYFWRNSGMIQSTTVLVRVATVVINHHDQSNLGRKNFSWLTLPYHCSSLKGVRTGSQTGQELEAALMKRPWRGAADWIALHSIVFLIEVKSYPQWAGPFHINH